MFAKRSVLPCACWRAVALLGARPALVSPLARARARQTPLQLPSDARA
jgi:hypothetical protein